MTTTSPRKITIKTRKVINMAKTESVRKHAEDIKTIEITTVKRAQVIIRIGGSSMVVEKAEMVTIEVKIEVGIVETNGTRVFRMKVATKPISISRIETKGTIEKKEEGTIKTAVGNNVSTSKSLINLKSTQILIIASTIVMTQNFF
jgi:hypothetical protein